MSALTTRFLVQVNMKVTGKIILRQVGGFTTVRLDTTPTREVYFDRLGAEGAAWGDCPVAVGQEVEGVVGDGILIEDVAPISENGLVGVKHGST